MTGYVCPVCKQETPPERIQYTKRRGEIKPKSCKPCNVQRMTEWKEKNRPKWRAAQRAHQKRRARRAVLYREVVEKQSASLPLDAMRRMLVDVPPELATEAEAAAYFRGFVAGAKRTGYESERFEKLKDLCHRIATEMSKWGKAGHFQSYEDNLGVAYEGLLAFIRKRTEYETDEHERRTAAMAIRNSIRDYARMEGPIRRGKAGNPRYEQAQIPVDEDGEMFSPPTSPDEPWRDGGLKDSLDQLDLDPRSRAILEGLANGVTYRELGERFGITESRACGIAAEIRERHGERLLAALT